MKLKPNKLQLLGLLPDALVMSRGPRQGNALYLSFDDGPHPEHTTPARSACDARRPCELLSGWQAGRKVSAAGRPHRSRRPSARQSFLESSLGLRQDDFATAIAR